MYLVPQLDPSYLNVPSGNGAESNAESCPGSGLEMTSFTLSILDWSAYSHIIRLFLYSDEDIESCLTLCVEINISP